jgi:hypothetical protein
VLLLAQGHCVRGPGGVTGPGQQPPPRPQHPVRPSGNSSSSSSSSDTSGAAEAEVVSHSFSKWCHRMVPMVTVPVRSATLKTASSSRAGGFFWITMHVAHCCCFFQCCCQPLQSRTNQTASSVKGPPQIPPHSTGLADPLDVTVTAARPDTYTQAQAMLLLLTPAVRAQPASSKCRRMPLVVFIHCDTAHSYARHVHAGTRHAVSAAHPCSQGTVCQLQVPQGSPWPSTQLAHPCILQGIPGQHELLQARVSLHHA